jgi:hypothetical protein
MLKRSLLLLVLILGCFLLSVAPAAWGQREVLVCDAAGPPTTIVLAAEATTAAQYGALELQYHLEKITGVKPAIVREPAVPAAGVRLAVGNTALGKSLGFPVDQLSPWEFFVAEKSGVIVLAGGDEPVTEEANWNSLKYVFTGHPNGSTLAVFEFLEEVCGVHWYLPSEAGMVTPETKRLVGKMGEPIRRRTDFRSTSFYPYQVNKNMFCRPVRPEVTDKSIPADELERWRRGIYNIPVQKTDMLPVLEVQRWLLRNKVGGERYGPNHSFSHWLERFGQQHPEWFSFRTTEKVAEVWEKYPDLQARMNHFQLNANPCLTAPGLFEQQMTDIRDYFDSQAQGKPPAAPSGGSQGRFYGLVLNDNYNYCQCEACKAQYNRPVVDVPLWGGAGGGASFYMWDFINRAARDLRRTHPDKWVAGIAYHNYMPPPKDFVLEPNVALTVCTYLGNWTAELRDTAYKLIRAWRDEAKCQWIGTWEYSCYSAFRGYMPMFPRLAPKLLGEDIKKLHQMGVVAEFNEVEDRYGFTDADNRWAVWSNPIWLYLNHWIRMKLYDDTGRPVEKLLDEHYRLFYGPAAEPLSRFFTRIEERVTDPSLRGPETFTNERSWNPSVDWEYLFPPAVMAELRGYVEAATRQATAEPFKTRVMWVREGFLEHVETEARIYHEQKKLQPVAGLAQAVCYATATPPTLDGEGQEEVWQAAPQQGLADWRSGLEPPVRTTFRLLHDATHLYLLAECEEPQVAALVAQARQRDDQVWQDDCIELHITADPHQAKTYQFIVNSRGVIQDIAYQRNEGGALVSLPDWNSAGVRAAARTHDRGYTVELAVPLADIGCTYAPGVRLTGNVCRERYAGQPDTTRAQLQSWSLAPEGFNDPQGFGQILLTPRDGCRLFAGGDNPPKGHLYRVFKGDPEWKNTPEAITVTPAVDHARFTLQVPPQEGLSSIKAALSLKCDPPVSVEEFPYFEIRYRKPTRELFLQVVYNYLDAEGKRHFNWFIFSPSGTAQPGPTLSLWKPGLGGDRDKPAPVKIESITFYANLYEAKTPPDCRFDLYWLRMCKYTMQGENPRLTTAAGSP